jgi:hypothetical protein
MPAGNLHTVFIGHAEMTFIRCWLAVFSEESCLELYRQTSHRYPTLLDSNWVIPPEGCVKMRIKAHRNQAV